MTLLGRLKRRVLRSRDRRRRAAAAEQAAKKDLTVPAVPRFPVPQRQPQTGVPALGGAYEATARTFYDFLPAELKSVFIDDAIYHRVRYLDMVDREFGSRVLELGSDKPFITHCLRTLHPRSEFQTISVDVPFSPYPVVYADIESEPFPFADDWFDDAIFTEVIEHLFRDPAWALWQLNRTLKTGGRLFLTTPNGCGYDVLQNILLQKNPNERNQFYARIESGHPHLWTAHELQLMLEQHGFVIRDLRTVDYYPMPSSVLVHEFIAANSVAPQLCGQVLRVEAERVRRCLGPSYPPELFPDGTPVRIVGALERWVLSKNNS